MIPPVRPWPTWLEGAGAVLAKSADRSAGGQAESLPLHTWRVLSRLADHYRLRPLLHQQIGEPRLWQRLFWACFLHDFGKAAQGCQAMLRGERPRWGHRHEVLSLAYAAALFPPEHPDRQWVAALIASHHQEAEQLYARYLEDTESAQEALADLSGQIDAATDKRLWRWVEQCSWPWVEALGLADVVEPAALPPSVGDGAATEETIRCALSEFIAFSDRVRDEEEFGGLALAGIFYRGLMQATDHSASAVEAQAHGLRPLNITRDRARGRLREEQLLDHQQAAGSADHGSAILVAPTGSGKTEAALLWAARQAEGRRVAPPRLFYVLPYQASMNAMHQRLVAHHFTDAEVGLQHAHALSSLYYDLLSKEDTTPETALRLARLKREVAALGMPPVRVLSPYQLLKALYALKGFEAQLLDYQQGLFVFDEIHAYEPKRLALIIEMIGWLRTHFAAHFLIMTATLPPTILQALEAALPNCQMIAATPALFKASQRHTLHLLEGELTDEEALERIGDEIAQGRSVLVCANTVRRAMDLYRRLCGRHPDLDAAQRMVLLHGRFNAADRKRKEKALLELAGTGVRERQQTVVVATQVVEVSLDIDLDVLYSDPAPLEALLQRFGRVNRGRPPGSPLKPVYVFSRPDDGQHVYRADLVQAGWGILRQLDGWPVDESEVAALLGEVYSGEIATRWWAEYRSAAEEFRQVILGMLRPFNSADEDQAQAFYRLFDGLEVLPLALEAEYREHLEAGRYLEAASLLVPLGYHQYARLERAGWAWREARRGGPPLYLVDLPYDPDLGLEMPAPKQAEEGETA